MTTLLLIEDHAPLRENLCELLLLEGYHVLAAADGRAGLQLALRESPALILCDIMMQGPDGYAVLERLRADPRTKAIPFIFLTAKP